MDDEITPKAKEIAHQNILVKIKQLNDNLKLQGGGVSAVQKLTDKEKLDLENTSTEVSRVTREELNVSKDYGKNAVELPIEEHSAITAQRDGLLMAKTPF